MEITKKSEIKVKFTLNSVSFLTDKKGLFKVIYAVLFCNIISVTHSKAVSIMVII